MVKEEGGGGIERACGECVWGGIERVWGDREYVGDRESVGG